MNRQNWELRREIFDEHIQITELCGCKSYKNLGRILSMTYPDIFWANRYTHPTHEGTTMVGAERKNLQNLCLQILKKCIPWLCLFLEFFVKHFRTYLSWRYEKPFLWMIFKNLIYSNKKFVKQSELKGCSK